MGVRGWKSLRAVVLGAQEPSNRVQWPLNRALRELGVARGEAFDEFDAVGLGKHRHTEDWLKAD
jgi:hypothetical protein